MIQLMDLSDWVEQIADQCPAFGGRVFKTIPDDELTIDLHESPCAFVYLAGDTSDENRLRIGIRQKMTSEISVEIIFRRTASFDDRFNDNAVDLIKGYRQEIFNALSGFEPGNTVKDVSHVSGALKTKEAKLIKWVDTFNTHTLIQSGPTA
jgi:hypothetical protein